MSNVDYKAKYLELRTRLLEATDVAYRTGYEQGMEKGQQAAQEQQMAEMQAQQMAAQGLGPDGQPLQQGAEGQDPNAMGGDPAMQDPNMGGDPNAMPMDDMGGEPGGELDSKLAELQELVSKGEKPKVLDLRKIVREIATVRKSQIENFKNKNKKVESAQRSLVKNILKKWDSESQSVTEDLEKILETDGLKLD